MKKIFFVLFILCLTFNSVYSQDFKKLDELSKQLIAKYNLPGIAIVGVKNGTIVYKLAIGKANQNNNYSDLTRIYIASNTKAFTALALNKLAFEKKINLSDPISKYIPASFFPSGIEVDKITIRQCLQHASGLSNDPLVFRTAYSGDYPADLEELLKFTVYRVDTLSHEFKYNNLGYLIGGIIIKRVTGESWREYIKENIFPKIGMDNTTANINFNSNVEVLPFKHNSKDVLSSRKTENTLHAAGGIYATFNDMGKWLSLFTNKNQNFINPELLKKYLNDRTIVNQTMGPFSMNEYGNGWIYGSLLGNKLFYHFGSFYGYESIMSFQPDENTGVFVFVNEITGGQRIAAMLSAYYYLIMSNDPEPDSKIKMFSQFIDPLYKEKNKEMEIFKYSDSDKLTGVYYSPEYGKMLVDKNTSGFTFRIGKLESIAYAGENENEIIIKWTPGIKEHFKISNKNGKTVLVYGEFGKFIKQ